MNEAAYIKALISELMMLCPLPPGCDRMDRLRRMADEAFWLLSKSPAEQETLAKLERRNADLRRLNTALQAAVNKAWAGAYEAYRTLEDQRRP